VHFGVLSESCKVGATGRTSEQAADAKGVMTF
jgi:hypothetical protein